MKFDKILHYCGCLIFVIILFQNINLLYMISYDQITLKVGDKILYTHKYYQKNETIKHESEITYYYIYYLFSCLTSIIISFYMIINFIRLYKDK